MDGMPNGWQTFWNPPPEWDAAQAVEDAYASAFLLSLLKLLVVLLPSLWVAAWLWEHRPWRKHP